MTDPRTIKSKTSLLIGLPSEIQGLISDCLNRHDLNRLCLTCKTIKAAVLPELYKQVIIKVPQTWSQLPYLEGLLGSTGDGLKYTTELFIDTQQDPLRDSQRGSEGLRSHEEVLAQPRRRFYLPQSSASDALNTLIRLLIVKLTQDRLNTFSWNHGCELNASTLGLVLRNQRGALRELSCNRYSSSCDENVFPSVEGLGFLSVESMDPDGTCEWAATMIVANAETLHHLHLGFTTRIAHDFALNRRPQQYQLPTSFVNAVREALSGSDSESGSDQQSESDQVSTLRLSLGSLYLCGLNLWSIIQGGLGFDIDFDNVTELRLESCPGLVQALPLLMDSGDSSKPALGALRDLFVRLEDPDPNFSIIFENLLTSIRGLAHLHVLIDNTRAVQNLEPNLSVHGETLKTLVWDERRGPRVRVDLSTSMFSKKLRNLKVISKKCKNLTTLGLTLDWEALSSSAKLSGTIGMYFRRMPDLDALVIRNLPKIGGKSAISMDYFVKGLAAMFLDIVNKNRKSAFFKTIALGAPLYKDVKVGTHHVAHTPVSDFLRFRVYSVDYNYPSPSGLSTVLSEVVKGAAVSADEAFTYQHLLRDYWLG